MSNLKILRKAFGEIGTKEVDGSGDNPRVVEYHRYATRDNMMGSPDSVPWCASYCCWVLEMVGLKSTNSKMARSFEKLGVDVKVKNYMPGDVIIFHRNGYHSGQGHVGFLVFMQNGMAYVLGGNQNDRVSVTKMSIEKMTMIRRVSEDDCDIDELKKLAVKIMYKEAILEEASVI